MIEMTMTDYKTHRLGDICIKIGSGATPRGGSKTYLASGKYALIRSQNVLDFAISNNGLVYISEEQARKLNNVTLVENDVLLNITGDSVGRVCQVPPELIPGRVNQHVAIIRPDPSILNTQFLKYYMLNPTFKDYMIMLSSSGGTRNAITKSMIEGFPIRVPSLSIQTEVTNILSSLDDKIELNNKINAELEALAQTLFKRWFVDFEFPDENGEPYKSSGGEMVESEMGMIPKGWKVNCLEKIASEVTRGFTTKYVKKSNVINLNQKVNRGILLDKSNFKYYSEDTDVPENKFARRNDILINSLGQGTLGRIHFYKELTNNVVIDQHITILRADENHYCSEILYLMLTYSPVQERLIEMVTGSTGMLMLNISKIREFKVVIPSIKLQELLKITVKPYFETINNNVLENECLICLRDTLLPKLLSGELDVSDLQTENLTL